MKNYKLIQVLLLSLLAGLMLNCTKDSHEGHGNGLALKGATAVKYVCPMHPQITSDKKGSCSICGMDLVLAESETEDEHEAHLKEKSEKVTGDDVAKAPADHVNFKLSLDKQQMIGVKLARVERRKLFKTIKAPGRIAFDPELYTAQSEYLEALKQWSRIKNSPIASVRQSTGEMIKSAKIRLKVMGLSDAEISRLGRKGSQSEALLLSSKKQKSWVYADIYEVDLPYMKEGLAVEITANFLQGKKVFGEVISVDEVINPKTRTAKVRIQLKENNLAIRPESYVSVSISAPLGEHLTVPLDSIMDTGREIFVFVKKGKGKFEPRIVNLIIETDNYAALIPKDLTEGEEVVVGANFMLDSESRLKSVIKGATSGSASGHNH